MPVPALLSNLLDCFSCCGQANKDARHDQYLQPLNLLQPQANSPSGACVAVARRCAVKACLQLAGVSSHLPAASKLPHRTVLELVEQSSAARERVWRSLGSLEPFALGQSPASNSVMAGPKWPAVRQNFRVIHRPSGNVMIVSDGLSDPFDDIHEGGWVGAGTLIG